MRTVASEVENAEVDGAVRSRSRSVAARKSRLRRVALEGLEARTLLSVLPAATPGTPINISNAAGQPEQSADRDRPL